MNYKNKKNKKRNIRINKIRILNFVIEGKELESNLNYKNQKKLPKPVGYPKKNIQIEFEGKRIWLWNRGHLKARSNGGSDDLENLIPQTSWLNYLAYSENGSEDQNRLCMRYYEKKFTNYDVEAIFKDGEVIPRQVKIITSKGEYILDNNFPFLKIDYNTGRACIKKEYRGKIAIYEEKNNTDELSDRKVYYLENSKTNAYWYNQNKLSNQMKHSDNKIENCMENEAKKRGMHHNPNE